jgi:ATP-binding cassette subfamily F protein 3
VLISHDRYFLDVTVNKTIEIWNKRLHVYSGNYERYLQQKSERRAQLEASYKNQRDQIEHLETFISRFRYQATKAKQVQSRVKELEKIERIEIPEQEETIHFTFPQPPVSGKTVMEVSALSKRYGEKVVIKSADFTIDRGDRIALVGVNGAGKSTLIRLLSELEEPSDGRIKPGHNVQLDYFAQDQYKALDPNARMLDDINAAAPRVASGELRSLLGCFLFSGEDVFKTLGVLSGGERNRYALARMLVSPANFLLLDEPTNHLDMRAKDVLLNSLRNYTGTVLFVSHDRYFIDGLATRVFEVVDGEVKIYSGNYEDYLHTKEAQQNAALNASRTSSKVTAPPSQTVAAPEKPQESAPENRVRRLNPIKLRQMRERCGFIEEELSRVEASIALTENALANFISLDETQRNTTMLDELRAQQASLIAEWEELSTTLDAQNGEL